MYVYSQHIFTTMYVCMCMYVLRKYEFAQMRHCNIAPLHQLYVCMYMYVCNNVCSTS